MEMNMANFLENVKLNVRKKGWTMQHFEVDLLGVSNNYFNTVEKRNGLEKIAFGRVMQICSLLDVELDKMFEKPKCIPTPNEIVFLKLLDKRWKWIVKDNKQRIWIYESKPYYNDDTNTWSSFGGGNVYKIDGIFALRYNFLIPGSPKPTEIQEVLDCYGGK